MDIFGPKLDNLVGSDKFFKHVSARAAFMLRGGHAHGLVKGSGDRSTRHSSHVGLFTEYFTNERSENWNGYDGDPANRIFPALGDPVLLDVLPNLSFLGDIMVGRTGTGTSSFVDARDGSSLNEAINDKLLPVGAATAFPAFDLYASALHIPQTDDSDAADAPYSWKTIQLIGNASMTATTTSVYPINAALLPATGSGEAWALWMKPAAALAANMGMALRAMTLTAGK